MANDNIELAAVYRITATSFRISAEILERDFKAKGEDAPLNYRATPFYYLISHACELLLKAALLKRDYSPNRLRQPALRHNLKNLTEALRFKGVELSTPTILLIEGLSSQHESHDLRYTALLDNDRPTYMPSPSELYAMLDELLMATRLNPPSP
jgi:hypothetical protein